MNVASGCLIGIVPVLDYAIRKSTIECRGYKPRYIVLHPQLTMELRKSPSMEIETRQRTEVASSIRCYYHGIPVLEDISAEYPFLRSHDTKLEYI